MLKLWLSSIVTRETFQSRVAAPFPCHPGNRESLGSERMSWDAGQCCPLERLAQVVQWWCEPGQLIVKEPGGHWGPVWASQTAGLSWGWTHCCVCFQMPLGKGCVGCPQTFLDQECQLDPQLFFLHPCSGLRRSFGRSKVCLVQSWWSELVHSLGLGLHRGGRCALLETQLVRILHSRGLT